MMSSKSLLLSICLLFFRSLLADAFIVGPQQQAKKLFHPAQRPSLLCAAAEKSRTESVAAEVSNNNEGTSEKTPDQVKNTILDEELMKEVRLELVKKYLDNGYSQDEAEKEVDMFLLDKERSEQYLEMRMYAAAQADDLGLGFLVQLVGGFLIGFVGIALPKFLAAQNAVESSGVNTP